MSNWTIDPAHTTVEFSVKHMMITTVRGFFSDVEGTIQFDEAEPARSSVEARIGAASVSTGAEARDNHLRSGDFFDAATHPDLTFRSTAIEPRGAGWAIAGHLTIRGTTLPVTLEAQALGIVPGMQGGRRAGFAAETKINRKDFGLDWNVALEAGGWLVGNDIKISLNVAAVEAAESDSRAA